MELHIGNISEVLSLIIAIRYYPYLKGTFMKWFLPFLFFICCAEFIMKYQWSVLHKPPIAINYLIGIVEILFYSYIFYESSSHLILRKLICCFIPLSILSFSISYYTDSSSYVYFIPNIVVSGFLLAAIALINVYLIYLAEEELNLISEPVFWIALGVSLFFSSISLSFSLYNLIRLNHLKLFGLNLYSLIPRLSSVILYSSISIAIILCKHQKKISSSQS